jgi:hypothetical protein
MISDAHQPSGREDFDALCRKLLVADWERPDGPLRLNGDLQLADLADADFFINVRLFLAALAEGGGAPATATGNLNRLFVGSMFDRLKLPPSFRESVREVCKVLNEQDLWPLHLVRVVAETAGLAARRNTRFRLTKAGLAALPEDQAGRLYRRLFLAYFRRFDLHYDFFLRDVPGIQETMAVILWRLDTVARDWTPVQNLAPRVLLPGVLHQLHAAMMSSYDTEEWILNGYVLDPLFDLGLIERRQRNERLSPKEHGDIRVSSLWRKFLGFQLV